MTLDEVMAMTDEELQIKAAGLTGWRHVRLERNYEGLENVIIGYPPHEWLAKRHYEYLRGKVFQAPDYLHDIAAAMELAEHRMNTGNGWAFTLYADRDNSGWAAVFTSLDNEEYRATGDVVVGKILYSTAPRAITRAFILAMEGGDVSR